MDIRNCKRCGKVFQYRNNVICSSCVIQEDEDFDKVRDFIVAHPNSSSVEVSTATKVDLKTIARFLREGRLESDHMDNSELGLQCEKCGQDINSGRYCNSCMNLLQSGLQDASQKLNSSLERSKSRESVTIHTYDNILKKK